MPAWVCLDLGMGRTRRRRKSGAPAPPSLRTTLQPSETGVRRVGTHRPRQGGCGKALAKPSETCSTPRPSKTSPPDLASHSMNAANTNSKVSLRHGVFIRGSPHHRCWVGQNVPRTHDRYSSVPRCRSQVVWTHRPATRHSAVNALLRHVRCPTLYQRPHHRLSNYRSQSIRAEGYGPLVHRHRRFLA